MVGLRADIAVVTAVAPEHMEYFETLDKVAQEELSVGSYLAKKFLLIGIWLTVNTWNSLKMTKYLIIQEKI
jgi:UDP-N-acetylmuramyl pentapeptide synthase